MSDILNTLMGIKCSANEYAQSLEELQTITYKIANEISTLEVLQSISPIMLPDDYHLIMPHGWDYYMLLDRKIVDERDPYTGKEVSRNNAALNHHDGVEGVSPAVARRFAECVKNGWLEKVAQLLHDFAVKDQEDARAMQEIFTVARIGKL